MPRTLTPELLDSLPPDDPAAIRSRRDLRLINHAMGNPRWWRRALGRITPHVAARPGLELGAGDGALARAHGLDALDPTPPPADWPAALRWHQTEVQTFNHWPDYDLVVANLFLHHLDDDSLRALGTRIAPHARAVLACEPHRRPGPPRVFTWFCALIGADPVTRHDGPASIRAGFAGDELPRLLGLAPPAWRIQVSTTRRGAYRMIAERVA